MTLLVEKVETFTRLSIPSEFETIADDCHIDSMAPLIKSIEIYMRPKESCPLNRGNWLVDMRFYDGRLISIKLPKQMREEHVKKFVQPLIDLMKSGAFTDDTRR